MAGLALWVNSGEVALVANTAKTVLQIKAPANQRLHIKEVRLMGKQPAGGTDTPIKVRVTRSTGNFGTGTAASPAKNNPSLPETIQSTAAANFTVEPTTPSDSQNQWEVQPQSGVIQPLIPASEIQVPGGAAVNFEATSPGAATVMFSVLYEE